MPRETANAVYEMKLAAERQRQLVELNPGLTDVQRNAMIEALARETQRGVAGLMGDDVYKAYERNGGNWVAGLYAPPVVPPELQAQQRQIPEPPLPPGLKNILLNWPNLPPIGTPLPLPINPLPNGGKQ